MKLFISSLILFGLFSTAFARFSAATVAEQEAEISQAKNELGRKKKKEQTGWRKTAGLTFTLKHFKAQDENGTTPFNKKLFSGAIKGAFEEVFEGMSMEWGFVENDIEIPEPDVPSRLGDTRNGRYYRIRYGNYAYAADCRLCPEDLLTGERFSDFLKDTKKWKEVGDKACAKLRALGIEEYSEVENGGFNVGYYLSEELDDAMKQMAQVSRPNAAGLVAASGSAKAQITMHQVYPKGNSNIDAIQEALALAYENVFDDSGISIDNVELLRQVNVPDSSSGEDSVTVSDVAISISNDESSGEDFETSMYWIKINWSCEEDDSCTDYDLLPGLLQNFPKTSLYSIFESYVCHNLRESGEAAFEDVTGCSILFEI